MFGTSKANFSKLSKLLRLPASDCWGKTLFSAMFGLSLFGSKLLVFVLRIRRQRPEMQMTDTMFGECSNILMCSNLFEQIRMSGHLSRKDILREACLGPKRQ